MIVKTATTLCFLLFVINAMAQPYTVENGKTRHRFAQSVIGFDLAALPGASIHLPEGRSIAVAPNLHPRIYVSGIHFWGHAEFYFNIPLGSLSSVKMDDKPIRFRQLDIFGTKVYPWRIEKNKIRPYAGFSPSLLFSSYGKGKEKFEYSRVAMMCSAGFVYYRKGWMIDAGFAYNLGNRRYDLFTSRTVKAGAEFSAFSVILGIRKVLETTIPMEKNFRNGITEKKFQQLKERKKLNSWCYGVGISSAFFNGKSDYLNEDKAYTGKKITGFPFPEIVAGYNVPKLRTHILSVLRFNGYNLNAYETGIKLRRYAAGIEAHVQLFDFHGFVPFAGVNGGYERLSYKETDEGIQCADLIVNKASFGFVFGWDIIPDKIQPFILRTNLRYFGGLDLKMVNGKTISLNQLEFNFIQFVYYPGRAREIKELNTQFNQQ